MVSYSTSPCNRKHGILDILMFSFAYLAELEESEAEVVSVLIDKYITPVYLQMRDWIASISSFQSYLPPIMIRFVRATCETARCATSPDLPEHPLTVS